MKQILIRRGVPRIEEVAEPALQPGSVLVRVSHSCISVGTELGSLRSGAEPLWRKVLRRPEQLRQLMGYVRSKGVSAARSLVQQRLQTDSPVGYSAAGVITEIASDVQRLRPGDRVACGGAQWALHAERICVPVNLVVPIPDAVAFAPASTVSIGAIALHGVRRANPQIGETLVVIGLGLVGQLTAQIARAGGCRVIGIDPIPERIAIARELGCDNVLPPDAESKVDAVLQLTGGVGADAVLITASSASDEIVKNAFQMSRRKGRVVLVGDVGLHIDRSDIYEKELDFLVSTSSGPGRYDPTYEEGGWDYPIAYVRWTENRNMAAYLDLLASRRVDVKRLISATCSVDDAPAAYEALLQGRTDGLATLIEYPSTDRESRFAAPPSAVVSVAKPGTLRIACVGTGSFARTTHLPNIVRHPALFDLRAVVSRTGPVAQQVARQFGAPVGTTDVNAVLQDPAIDAVLIATRHDSHAALALAALRAGKHVLVEKPLVTLSADLDAFREFYRSGVGPVLLTGFNRRFSAMAVNCARNVSARTQPMIMNYTMNAGRLPPEHWTQTQEGGGRNVGEACHIYDLFTFLTGAQAQSVSAAAIRPANAYAGFRDNFVASIEFADGSVGTLTYTALGSDKHPKERLEIFCDGEVMVIDDYLRLSSTTRREPLCESRFQDKGHEAEMLAFHAAVTSGKWPSQLWEQAQAMEIAFAVERSLAREI